MECLRMRPMLRMNVRSVATSICCHRCTFEAFCRTPVLAMYLKHMNGMCQDNVNSKFVPDSDREVSER